MHAYDLYAIGNALVDTEYQLSDADLAALGVTKGQMTLIDTARRAALLAALPAQHHRRSGGGSAGNTIVAAAQFGARTYYSCRVADDELGDFYAADLTAHGVASNLSHTRAPEGSTGTCLVLITPDAERSMNTFLGATADLDAAALHKPALTKSRIYYMEGYLSASPSGLDAALQGREIAAQAGVQLAATLSDVSMITYCRAGLDALLGNVMNTPLDYLFCNADEARAWTAAADWADICTGLRQHARTVCITRGAQGCLLINGANTALVPGVPVQALDSNGAGDMFAGAFLSAISQGQAPSQAAELANRAAARVVAQYGNRLAQADIDDLRTPAPQTRG